MPVDHHQKVTEFIDFIGRPDTSAIEIQLYLALWLLPDEPKNMAEGLQALDNAGFRVHWVKPVLTRTQSYTLKVEVHGQKINVSGFISPEQYQEVKALL